MVTASIYFDEDGEFLIIPESKNEEGWWTEVNEPERLQWDGVSVMPLGEKVLKSLAVSASRIGPPRGQISASMLAAGAKSYRAFAKTRQCVSIESVDDEHCLHVSFWRRDANFMYSGPTKEHVDWTVVLPLDASPEAVGGAVIQVLRAGGVRGV